MPTASELPIDTSASAMDMANAMFGNGIQVVSATYTGATSASGIYSDGDTVAPDITPSDTGVILSTGMATSITNSSGDANTSSGTSTNHHLAGDAELNLIAGAQTYDAAVFQASFIAEGSTLTMQVVFSSEEYLEYVGSGFNDAVGIWVNGVQAELTVSDGDTTIAIDSINDESNSNLYVDNPANAEVANTEMDGFTVTLTLNAPVTPGQLNTIKIAIADGGDAKYDSNLLIAGDSIQTALIAENDTVEITGSNVETIDVLSNDSSTMGGTLTITAINGRPVSAGDMITLPSGETITLNADGTFTIDSDGSVASSNTFSYQVTDAAGNTDTAFVTINTTPCFVAGTLIDTTRGKRAVETLAPGDMVLTKDHGPQPVRWVGCTERIAQGADAPILFTRNALGRHGAVAVSPNHRILLEGPVSELLFGEAEVLVKAMHLENGRTIRRCADGKPILYVHVLFDRHEVIRAEGLESESYHPGDMSLNAFDPETRAELLRLMPDLSRSDFGFGPSARPMLRGYEARTLLRA
ncbi:choice-of-anchor L domain-containing protein [Ruegeria marina]|uniref:Hint domain-containing protein n=1 Tax=Ruegeria marina TaxID=639004 RepID=A0A1G6N9V6_9RHOB|nr:choice-of-anchor L domain-containing protein [Ruegeria marina]SDC64593.1 Hint domain-containing protein [Ruegeria marina]